jgi:CheY-like chemotaxis protein
VDQLHALIIDDNVPNLGVLSQLLLKQNVTSTGVVNPMQLDSVLEQLAKVNIAFVDLELPEMNGYEVLERLRTDRRFRSIPIVAYTVHVSEMKTAHQQGFHSFLGKPLDAESFPDQLAKILAGEPVWSL